MTDLPIFANFFNLQWPCEFCWKYEIFVDFESILIIKYTDAYSLQGDHSENGYANPEEDHHTCEDDLFFGNFFISADSTFLPDQSGQ